MGILCPAPASRRVRGIDMGVHYYYEVPTRLQ